jgi:hypothetical protein
MTRNLINKGLIAGVILFIMIFLNTATNNAADLTLSWNPPTTDANGNPLTDLKGYTVYHGTGPGNYSKNIYVGNATTYTVTGLTDGFTYHFAVTASDKSGNESEYSNEVSKTVQPSDSTPPVISGVSAGNITISSSTINWTTNELADTQVEYGTSTSYGSTTILNSSKVTSHSQNISNLSPSTLYHYRVLSRDAAGNLAVSGGDTFTTASLLPVAYYCDSDSDGYIDSSIDGTCAGAGCEPAGCLTTQGNDCNDNNSNVNPAASDSNCNGIDDNCDGTPDNRM